MRTTNAPKTSSTLNSFGIVNGMLCHHHEWKSEGGEYYNSRLHLHCDGYIYIVIRGRFH